MTDDWQSQQDVVYEVDRFQLLVHFAGYALMGLVMKSSRQTNDSLAHDAFALADAMLAEVDTRTQVRK